ncbi:hypothetical protein ACIP6T_07250 [Pantoea sp. NPDC088449]|uniref:hypothetical protein n=1 Tax=Pantoea sp. NPDC088449 TaxID=3364392 RepID=UPI003825B1DD
MNIYPFARDRKVIPSDCRGETRPNIEIQPEERMRITREFALAFSKKLLEDNELNAIAPFVIDKIVVMLINESRGF